MRRKRTLCSISISVATAIHDGTLPSSSAAFVFPAPTYDLATVTNGLLSRSPITDALTGIPARRSMLARKLAASGSSDANDINPTPLASSATLLQSILLDQSIEDISDRISSRIVLPFYVPQPIISAATTLAIHQLTTDVFSSELLERIGEVAAASASSSASATELMDNDGDDDGISDDEELERLSGQIATELNDQIDLPVLNEDQEFVIFEAIGRSLMAVLTVPDEIEADPKQVVDMAVETAQELLKGKEGRRKLAEALNARLDFPILNEEGEQDLLERALDACSDRLVEVLPRELVEALKGESCDGLEKTKEFVVVSLNRKVDIIGLTEDQERQLIEMLVDVCVDILIGDTEVELILMNPEERINALEERTVVLTRQLEISKKRHEAEQANLVAQIRRIEERIGEG